MPWADVGMFAGAPETRRILARVYGDGSLPFTLSEGKNNLRLSFLEGEGRVEGEANGYAVYAWKKLG